MVGLNYREVGDGEIRNLCELLRAHQGSMQHIGLHMENDFNGERRMTILVFALYS